MNRQRPTLRKRARKPSELSFSAWWGAVRRLVPELFNDRLSDWAAALTYYGVLSIFPALLAVISLVGLAGRDFSDDLIANLDQFTPPSVQEILTGAIRQMQEGRGGAGLVALIGLAAAMWSASKYVAAFMRASNDIYDVPEGRPIWKTLPIRIAVTVATLVLLAFCSIAVVFTGRIADAAGELLGLNSGTVTVWDFAKWPVLLLIVAMLIAMLYWIAPNARQSFRWLTPGSLLALLIWLAASAGFAVYVALFDSYNKTYGSLAGIIVFLVWLWISNLAILLGAELNSELERSRAIAAGLPKDVEPYMELRDTRGLDDPPAAR